jgi:hypothetical protein
MKNLIQLLAVCLCFTVFKAQQTGVSVVKYEDLENGFSRSKISFLWSISGQQLVLLA